MNRTIRVAIKGGVSTGRPYFLPVVAGTGAQGRRRFPPFKAQRLDRGQHQQYHQGKQEIQVHDDQAGEGIKREAVVVGIKPKVRQEMGDDPGIADGGYEGKGEGHATRVGEHTATGSDQPPHHLARRADQRHRPHQAQYPGQYGARWPTAPG